MSLVLLNQGLNLYEHKKGVKMVRYDVALQSWVTFLCGFIVMNGTYQLTCSHLIQCRYENIDQCSFTSWAPLMTVVAVRC